MAHRDSATHGERDIPSLTRRLKFAGDSTFFFNRLFCGRAFRRFAHIGRTPTPRLPDHVARIAFDLLECMNGSYVTHLGNPESALLDVDGLLPQHPQYRAYWHDTARHSSVSMIVGIDIVHHEGRYHILEVNAGPTFIARRRRALYGGRYDPFISGVVSAAKSQGFKRLVLIALAWDPVYLREFERAASEQALTIVPTHCPIARSGTARIVGLPDPLEPETMYVIHSGLITPLSRYIDNKWYMSGWLQQAIESDLPKDTKVAMPCTRDSLFLPNEDPGDRWPNLVIKLAEGSGSRAVIAGRFEDEEHARKALGLSRYCRVPKHLRRAFAANLLFNEDVRIVYQSFFPPELDDRQRMQLVRMHLLLSPRGTTYLDAHLRVSLKRLPERVPSGILSRGDTFIFNRSEYRPVPPQMDDDLQEVAAHIGHATQSAISRKFRTS